MRILLSFLLFIGSAGAWEIGNIGAGQAIAQMILAIVLLNDCTRSYRAERRRKWNE